MVERRKRAGTRVVRNSPGRGCPTLDLDAVAFIYPSEQHEGIRRIGQGFQQTAHDVERRVVTLTTGMNFRQEAEIIGRLNEFDVKGAVVYPVLPEPQDRLFFAQMLIKCRFPVVLVNIDLPGFGAPAVVIDGFHAGYTMTRHLIAQGLRKIGFLANESWTQYVQTRYVGYRRALEEAGIEENPLWVMLEPDMHPDFQHPVNASHILTTQFLKSARGIEGVVCANDILALSCLDSAREMGLRVPEDLKVVGIDDFALSAQSALTTYHVPFEELGRQSFQMLNRLIQGEQLSTAEPSLLGGTVVRKTGLSLRGSLVVRKSG
jgi:DNA-binding LacI/PurR family transcriptional regulator